MRSFALTAAILITCVFTTKGQLLSPYGESKFSIGLDIARPLISIGLNQTEFEGYFNANFSKSWGASVQFGFEKLPYRQVAQNVWGISKSQYMSFALNYKLIPKFWLNAYFITAKYNELYSALLNGPNFYQVVRNYNNQFNSYGVGGRMIYYEVLTHRIEASIYIDSGLMFDLGNNVSNSLASPGYLIGAGRALYLGAGINVGYRILLEK